MRRLLAGEIFIVMVLRNILWYPAMAEYSIFVFSFRPVVMSPAITKYFVFSPSGQTYVKQNNSKMAYRKWIMNICNAFREYDATLRCLNVLQTFTVASHTIRINTCVTKPVSYPLSLGCIGAVRQNMHILYQCRYYLLLYSELCMDTSDHNQFDTIMICHICVHCNRMRWYCKSFGTFKHLRQRSRTVWGFG